MLLVDDVERWFSDRRWTATFGVVTSAEREHWGMLESLRARYDHGIEVEFGFTSPAWAALPLDPGTVAVLRGGFRVLSDPDGILAAAVAATR